MNVERLEAIHALVKTWPTETAWKHDIEFSDEVQPILLSRHDYKKLFMGGEQPDKKWFISFVKTFRSQEAFYHSEWVMNTMKVLADEY